jgi:hypothetical protein
VRRGCVFLNRRSRVRVAPGAWTYGAPRDHVRGNVRGLLARLTAPLAGLLAALCGDPDRTLMGRAYARPLLTLAAGRVVL